MSRNPKDKHLKRINAPKAWLLDKLSGVWAPRPSPGPHKLRECLPIIIMLRNRLKYALTAREVRMIVSGRHIRIDGKVRTDTRYPCGFQDVVTINRTGEHFRLLYDVKGRFHLHRIPVKEATWKLCKVVRKGLGVRAIPYIATHDGRTMQYPDPSINLGDTIVYDFLLDQVKDILPFKTGSVVMVTGGRNVGRVGLLTEVEKHMGSFDIVKIKDKSGHSFATRKDNIFIIGKGKEIVITLPKSQGIKQSIIQERNDLLNKKVHENPYSKKAMTGGTVLPPHIEKFKRQLRERRELLKQLEPEKPKAKKKGRKQIKKDSEKE